MWWYQNCVQMKEKYVGYCMMGLGVFYCSATNYILRLVKKKSDTRLLAEMWGRGSESSFVMNMFLPKSIKYSPYNDLFGFERRSVVKISSIVFNECYICYSGSRISPKKYSFSKNTGFDVHLQHLWKKFF